MAIEPLRAVGARVRLQTPLIHNIANHVVMNVTANALLAFGASPAMVHAPEEAAEFAAIAKALVVNIGTLDATFVAGMEAAAAKAAAIGLPWVLDPVGVGATAYRREVCARLIALNPSVIRGNAGEILTLAGEHGAARGVDSLAGSEAAVAAAKALSKATGAVVAVTGRSTTSWPARRRRLWRAATRLSQKVTGTGCITTALVGACLAVAPPRDAALAGLQAMKQAASQAAARASAPGSFAVALIDALAE